MAVAVAVEMSIAGIFYAQIECKLDQQMDRFDGHTVTERGREKSHNTMMMIRSTNANGSESGLGLHYMGRVRGGERYWRTIAFPFVLYSCGNWDGNVIQDKDLLLQTEEG